MSEKPKTTNTQNTGGRPAVNVTNPPPRPDPRVVPPAVKGDYPPKPLPTKPAVKK